MNLESNVKISWRDAFIGFIKETFSTPSDKKVLCFPGDGGREIIEVYRKFNIPDHNIVAVEKDTGIAKGLRERFPNVDVQGGELHDYVTKNPNERFDIVSLDFMSTYEGNRATINKIIQLGLLKPHSILGTNFFYSREAKATQKKHSERLNLHREVKAAQDFFERVARHEEIADRIPSNNLEKQVSKAEIEIIERSSLNQRRCARPVDLETLKDDFHSIHNQVTEDHYHLVRQELIHRELRDNLIRGKYCDFKLIDVVDKYIRACEPHLVQPRLRLLLPREGQACDPTILKKWELAFCADQKYTKGHYGNIEDLQYILDIITFLTCDGYMVENSFSDTYSNDSSNMFYQFMELKQFDPTFHDPTNLQPLLQRHKKFHYIPRKSNSEVIPSKTQLESSGLAQCIIDFNSVEGEDKTKPSIGSKKELIEVLHQEIQDGTLPSKNKSHYLWEKYDILNIPRKSLPAHIANFTRLYDASPQDYDIETREDLLYVVSEIKSECGDSQNKFVEISEIGFSVKPELREFIPYANCQFKRLLLDISGVLEGQYTAEEISKATGVPTNHFVFADPDLPIEARIEDTRLLWNTYNVSSEDSSDQTYVQYNVHSVQELFESLKGTLSDLNLHDIGEEGIKPHPIIGSFLPFIENMEEIDIASTLIDQGECIFENDYVVMNPDIVRLGYSPHAKKKFDAIVHGDEVLYRERVSRPLREMVNTMGSGIDPVQICDSINGVQLLYD